LTKRSTCRLLKIGASSRQFSQILNYLLCADKGGVFNRAQTERPGSTSNYGDFKHQSCHQCSTTACNGSVTSEIYPQHALIVITGIEVGWLRFVSRQRQKLFVRASGQAQGQIISWLKTSPHINQVTRVAVCNHRASWLEFVVVEGFQPPNAGCPTAALKKKSYPRYRPWRPIELWDVKDPTLSRQSAHR
jgi:hypothetical protein